ncbi:lysosomal alpha-mannosidase isoform X1 [Trichogramma pretiosum]|uniref:lysosomal alpha-mannosidase isoform X1 n=1 Tax=Trichogramma pretiosum TaxID=7493 RepID=UPI0006C97DCA|nr:lysosomal alpha-mannosidase isoform X1 [Trichogramma pretiosum]
MGLLVTILTLAVSLFFIIGLGVGARLPRADEIPTCGYESCTKSDPDKINIHLVAHTHDDVGWLKTLDQYYYGGRMNIQVAGVEYIIDSVIEALNQDPARKFIYVETAFLWKWWQHQGQKKRELMRKFIDEGRLEIIGGGWAMNDEAVTHYHSMIDQYTWGFRRLNDTFGQCARPKIGWQIDPFGHSREQASMFAQMGFDGMLFGRLDYQDKSKRLQDKTAEFIWKASPSLGSSSDLFTTMLYNNYGPPPGFCFDILCQDSEPMIDDADSPDYNIDRRLEEFLNYSKNQAKYYRSNNIILTMGGDFTYQYAEMYFKNMDKLIRYVNEKNGTDFKAFYSSPSCYLKSLNEQKLAWPVKSDDFFPYASDPHAFWTGYFSSRPTLKFFERMGNNFLQVVKQMLVLSNQPDNKQLQLFREAMGVMQHHDAVTGTEKQHVAEDYARLLYRGFRDAEKLACHSMNLLARIKEVPKPAKFHSCPLLNISSCEYSSDNRKFVVSVYNPMSQPLTTFVRLPVNGVSYSVKDYSGRDIITQLVPIPDPVQKIPGRFSSATRELLFQAVNIAPLGYQMFYVSEKDSVFEELQNDQPNLDYVQTIGRDMFKISIESDSKVKIKSLKSPNLDYTQSFHYFEGAEGNNKIFVNRSSGAYIFRPKENFAKDLPDTGVFQIFKGPLVEEIHQIINDWVSQVIRIYNGKNYVEFNWLVGPIPVNDKTGKEVITKYSSNLKTNSEFYTDSNGRDMLKRKLNYRPTWDLRLQEPISGNYYPVTSKISIEDKSNQLRLSALTDRAQGGSSLEEGELQLMLHRRLLSDDAFGVGEALNESAYGQGLVARGQHFLLGGSMAELDQLLLEEKEIATELALRPWIFVSPTEDSFEEWNKNYRMKSNDLIGKLPKNVKILTLEPWKEGEVLLRLEHLFEKDESPKYSVPASVDLKELFSTFTIHSVRETVLSANQWIEDLNRLQWQSEGNEVPVGNNKSEPIIDSFVVRLNPMEIRTFIITSSFNAESS